MKKLYIETYGCQMNVYDSGRIADLLAPFGYVATPTADDADLVILNTCHIREKATEKVYSELGRLKQLKNRNAAAGKNVLIGVAGCVAQAEGREIVARQPAVDLVVGPQSYHRLPELLGQLSRGERGVVELDFPAQEKFDSLSEEHSPAGAAAFLTIQEGCDKFCSFCVVPYTRGPEFSRPVVQLEKEANGLAEKGVQELTLLGQNVNAYAGEGPNGDRWDLARLIRHLAAKTRIARLRYTTSHPLDMTANLIAAHRDEPKLMPYLHLPVQSGSDNVLKAMNRGHSRADYLCAVEKVRKARPDLALSSDFIIGFPGESDDDFEQTLDLVRKVEYAQAFSFKYSARPGTPAAARDEQIPDAVKSQRLYALQALLTEQTNRFNAAAEGRVMPVLFDRPGRRPGQAAGRSPYLQAVHVNGAAGRIGEIHDVRITKVLPNSLLGELVCKAAPAQACAH